MTDREKKCHKLIEDYENNNLREEDYNKLFYSLVDLVGVKELDKKILRSLFTRNENNICSKLINYFIEENNEKAYSIFFKKYQPIILGYMERQSIRNKKIPKETAEDLSQKVLINIYQNKTKINNNCEGWVHTICKRVFIDYTRKASTKLVTTRINSEKEGNEKNAIGYDSIDGTIYLETWRECIDKIFKVIKKSDPDLMDLYQLIVEGYTPTEIQERVGGTSKKISKEKYIITKRLKPLIDKHCQEQIL